jgi:hypothetical protein
VTPLRKISVVDLHDAIAVTSITDDVVHVGFAGGDRHENIRRETVLCSAFLKV